MKTVHFRFLFGIFIFSNMMASVLPIKCWSCKSMLDPKCGEPFDNSTLPITDCNYERVFLDSLEVRPNVCRIIRQKVNGQWNNYVRDCAYLSEVSIQNYERICEMRIDNENKLTEYCTCNGKDGCNSSSMISAIPIVLLTLVGLSFIIKY